MTLSMTEWANRKHRVNRLCELGLTQTEIAGLMKIGISQVWQICLQLRGERGSRKTSSHSMAFRRAHGQEVPNRALIRQILREKIVPKNPWYSIPEVTKMIPGIKKATIDYLCRTAQIPCSRQGNGKGRYVISKDGIEAIKQWLRATTECIFCHQEIPARENKKGPKKRVCDSPGCRERHRKKLLQDVLERPLTQLKDPCHIELCQQFSAHPIPRGDRQVGIKEASRISGIKHPFLSHLADCGLFKIRLSKKKKWRGRPTRLFSCWQMKIARRVYAKHHS